MDREEALKISGTGTLDRAVRYFVESPLRAFMVTDGTNPVTVYADHEKPVLLPVSEALLSRTLSEDHNADTTGAGDNFVGGVIYSLARQVAAGMGDPDLVEAAKWGIVSGGFACTYMGGTYLENNPGEKRDAIFKYYAQYEEQLKHE